jgi:hypothetical protein
MEAEDGGRDRRTQANQIGRLMINHHALNATADPTLTINH